MRTKSPQGLYPVVIIVLVTLKKSHCDTNFTYPSPRSNSRSIRFAAVSASHRSTVLDLAHAEEGTAGVDLEAERDGDDHDSADCTQPSFPEKAHSEAGVEEDVAVTRAI